MSPVASHSSGSPKASSAVPIFAHAGEVCAEVAPDEGHDPSSETESRPELRRAPPPCRPRTCVQEVTVEFTAA